MDHENTAYTLASTLPVGITYDPKVTFDSDVWNARRIAEFQAKRLAESGYQLVYVDEATVERVAQAFKAAWHAADDRGESGRRTLAEVTAVLAALADPAETGGAA